MRRHLLLPLPTAATTLFLLLLLHPTASSPSPDNSLSTCNRTFNCGPLVSVSYPFTGGDRPAHCGPPGLRLSCVGDSPELTAGSLTYRVLAVNQTRRSLTLSRADLYNSTCLQRYENTTLNSTIFPVASDNEDLTLFYDCRTWLTDKPPNLFNCEVNGTETDNYYSISARPTVPPFNVSECNVSVTVPILRSAVSMLIGGGSQLLWALMEGFEVNFTDPYEDQCVLCGRIGGECGFDSDLGKPICICGDQICPTSTAGSKNQVPLVTGLALAGAGITGLLLGVWIFSYRQKRNKKRAAAEAQSKSITQWKLLLFKKEKDRDVERLMGIHGSLVPRRYRYIDVKKMTNSFSEKLGQGGFGTVYKGKIRDGSFVAVKILTGSKSCPEEFINEVVSISGTSYINVISLLGFCYEGNKRALIFDYMPNGSLDKFISSGRALNMSSSLEWKILYKIAVGVARGLEYLHRGCNTRILHFDIKPQNILVDRDFIPKISDFGLAKLCHGRESAVSTPGMRGTVGYIAPEVVFRNLGRVSHKSDVYSYGMLVLEMVGIRNSDIKVSNSSEMYFPEWIYRNLEPGKDLKLPMNVTEEEEVLARKMIIVSLWCIQTNPSDRPPIGKVIEMLEGSFELLQTPPKPMLYAPTGPSSQNWELTTLNSNGSHEEDRLGENLEESNNKWQSGNA